MSQPNISNNSGDDSIRNEVPQVEYNVSDLNGIIPLTNNSAIEVENIQVNDAASSEESDSILNEMRNMRRSFIGI